MRISWDFEKPHLSEKLTEKEKLKNLEAGYRSFLQQAIKGDSAHDISHTERVVANAKMLLKGEQADIEVVTTAAWLHDCVVLPKNHPDRRQASLLASKKAGEFLTSIGFEEKKRLQVQHAIHAHSFSAGVRPETIEAKIVQDADRLDALGAIGIARCFLVGGELNRALYHPDDPFCLNRPPDDALWTVDHFYVKLFELPALMHTDSAKKEAKKRVAFMKTYLDILAREIG